MKKKGRPRVCKLCGAKFKFNGYYCPSCYAYLRIHPEGIYPQPEYGEVLYASNGDPVCHICCMAYRKLGNHIQFRHHMSQNEYREKYGLFHCTRLSNPNYVEQMRFYNRVNKKTVIDSNLIEKGKKTRVSKDYILPGRKIGNGVIQYNIISEETR